MSLSGEEHRTPIDRVVTHGTFELDGGSWEVDNNIWLVGDDSDVVVFDVSIGRAKYYLATRWDNVAGTPSCAACHGPARADNPRRNPHTFVDRCAPR